jgi:DNA-binding CsgD family transcriptional regulator
MPQKLSPRESAILSSLAAGNGYLATRQALGINGSTLHIHCYNIRKKTGIADTRSPAQCAAWKAGKPIEALPTVPRALPTPAQSEVLRLSALGKSNGEIAALLNIHPATVANHKCQGKKRLASDPWAGLI